MRGREGEHGGRAIGREKPRDRGIGIERRKREGRRGSKSERNGE